MSSTALTEVKNYLNITWTDTDTDSKVTSIIERAESIITDLAGITLAADSMAGNDKQLFLDLCRYIYNDSYEDFKKNFADSILEMRNKYSVKAFKEAAINA